MKSLQIKIKNWFSVIAIFIIDITYVIFMLLPSRLIERDSLGFVEKCLTKICDSTGKNARELMDEIKTLDWCEANKISLWREYGWTFLFV